MHHPA